MAKLKRLFWDLEVSPNLGFFWRTGRKINIGYENIVQERKIISVAWNWEGSSRVYSLTWDENQDDKKLIEEFVPILNSADESVAHFGDSFDLKWLKGRALKHGIPMLPKYTTIDTCKVARQNFYLNSVKLDYLAKFLGIGQKLRTEDGLWIRVVLDKCSRSLEFMVKYNRWDVILLKEVFYHMEPYFPHKTHVGVLAGNEKWTCPKDGGKDVRLSKTRVNANGGKQYQMQCICGSYYTIGQKAYDEFLKQ